jgi:hypothetical protein
MLNSLTRYYGIFKAPWNFIFSFVVLKAIQTPAAIALILCIVGATSANEVQDVAKQGTVRAGVIIYLVVYIALVLLTAGAALGRRMTGRGEVKLLVAVATTLPVLLVRLIYSMLSAFSDDKVFSPVTESTSSTTVDLFMATIEEMVVVLVYIWVGLASDSVPTHTREKGGSNSTLLHRAGRGDFGGGKLGLLSLGAGAIDEIRHHRRSEKQREQAGQDIESADPTT